MSGEAPRQVVLPPIQFGAALAQMPDGSRGVMVIFQTIYGQSNYPMPANSALDLARRLRGLAKEASTGITRVERRLIGPNGAPIPTTGPVIDDLEDDEPEEPIRENEVTA